MSTLREPLKHLDFIMDKYKKEVIYMVLHEELHSVWVIADGGGAPPFELPKTKINQAFIKVDPKVVKVLYGDNKNDVADSESNTDSEPVSGAV